MWVVGHGEDQGSKTFLLLARDRMFVCLVAPRAKVLAWEMFVDQMSE